MAAVALSGSSATNTNSADTRLVSERTVLVTAALGSMLAPLNSTMIVVALPDILDRFGRSLTWGSWIVLSYLVAMASVQPLGGSLGDRYGRRRLFLLGLVGFLIATVVAALAWRIEVLIVARTIQAVTGAIAIPNGIALVRSLVPADRQGRAFGSVGAWIAVAAAVGPPLGGIVTDSLGWRWIFAANILLITPALILGLRLPADRQHRLGQFDLRGAMLLTISLISLALGLTIWKVTSIVDTLVFGVVGIAAGWLLLRHVRRVALPVLNVSLFRRPGYTPATLTVLFSNLAMYTLLLSLPVFLARDVGWSSSQVGLLLAGLSLQMVVFSPVGGALSDRLGRRAPALLGVTLLAAGVAPFAGIAAGWPWYAFLLPLIVVGIGLGLSSAPVQTTALEAAPHGETGQAAGLFSTMRYLGSILGSAGMAAILSGSRPTIGEFRLLFAALLIAAILAIGAAARLPGPLKLGRPADFAPAPQQPTSD